MSCNMRVLMLRVERPQHDTRIYAYWSPGCQAVVSASCTHGVHCNGQTFFLWESMGKYFFLQALRAL